MPHAKAYKKYTMALLFRRINEFKKNKTRVLHQYHLILRSNRNEQKTHVIHLLNANPVGFRPHVQLQLWLVPQVVQGWSVFCAGLSHSKRSLSHCHHKSNELARGTGKLSISTKINLIIIIRGRLQSAFLVVPLMYDKLFVAEWIRHCVLL
jgi:hypothetical protein